MLGALWMRPHSAAARIYAGRFISTGKCLPDMRIEVYYGALSS